MTVNPKKCPTLARCLARGEKAAEKAREDWARLVKLRRQGKGKRLARRLLGVKPGPPMPEEVKARWREKREAE